LRRDLADERQFRSVLALAQGGPLRARILRFSIALCS
jgi:hypothetical protein